MSQENVELARRAFLGWNDRGVEALIDDMDPEVEFHAPKESMSPGVYRGHDGVREYFGRVGEMFEEQRVEAVDVIDVDDDCVIAVIRGFGRTPHFEAEVEVNWAWLITVKDRKATRAMTFTDRRQALEAAGLSE
jgi:ketosteroid isomerase-like protein